MDVMQTLGLYGLVPVVVLESADDAIPTVDALSAGGLPVIEITLRTAAALDSIRQVAQSRPQVLVGAGTVINVEQAQKCVEAGARFIVSPGFDRQLVEWCLRENVPVTPGCVTPSEIGMALSYGIDIVKFFPAGVYGGLSAMKALAAPFTSVRFIPTGGVNLSNLSEYAAAPFIHAIGGSFICGKKDIQQQRFDKIESGVRESLRELMGFSFKHVGINTTGDAQAEETGTTLASVFGLDYMPGNSSNFAGSGIEIVKGRGAGQMGHIAISTNNVHRAAKYLEARGTQIDWQSAKEKDGALIAVYLRDEFAGFAVHLLQK